MKNRVYLLYKDDIDTLNINGMNLLRLIKNIKEYHLNKSFYLNLVFLINLCLLVNYKILKKYK